MQTPKCLFSALPSLRPIFHPRPLLLLPRPRLARLYSIPQPTPRRLPRDHEILNTYCTIHDEHGILHPSVRTRSLLATLNPRTHHLVATEAPPLARDIPARCRIVSREEMVRMAEQERKKAGEARRQKKVAGQVVKKVEMNWAIDGNDLLHKVERMKEFLGRGFRVEVWVSPKRRGRVVGVEEAEALLAVVRGVLVGEGEGARRGWKEWKGMEGSVCKQATLFFMGKVEKGAGEVKADEAGDGAEEKEDALHGEGDDAKRQASEKQASEKEASEKELTRKQAAKREKQANEKQASERELTRKQAAKREKWKMRELGDASW